MTIAEDDRADAGSRLRRLLGMLAYLAGAGEASIGPTAAAIGNALRAALGVAVRTLPLTAEQAIAAL